MTNFERFLQWEETDRDTIKVKRMYVDIAGDLAAGVLLSQIIYWYLPSKRGTSKLRVVKDGQLWLAKGRDEWWEECRLLPDRFDRTSDDLVKLGVIEKGLFRFDGSPTVHVRLVPEVLMEKVNAFLDSQETQRASDLGETPKSIWANPLNPFGRNAKMDFGETPKTLTETTTEITTETTTKTKEYVPRSARRVNIAYSQDFEEFWKVYPRKIGKKPAFGRWMVRLNDKENHVCPSELTKAARNYAEVCRIEARPTNYIMHAETFLGPDQRYADYLDPSCIEEAKKNAEASRRRNRGYSYYAGADTERADENDDFWERIAKR